MGCTSSRQVSQTPKAKPSLHVPSNPRPPDVSGPPANQDLYLPQHYYEPQGFTTEYDSCALPPNDIPVTKQLNHIRKPPHGPASFGDFVHGHIPQSPSKQVRVVGRTAGTDRQHYVSRI